MVCLIKISHIDLDLNGLKKRLADSDSIVIELEGLFKENVSFTFIFLRFLNKALDVQYKTVFSVIIVLDLAEHDLAFFLMVECEGALNENHQKFSFFRKLGKRIPCK